MLQLGNIFLHRIVFILVRLQLHKTVSYTAACYFFTRCHWKIVAFSKCMCLLLCLFKYSQCKIGSLYAYPKLTHSVNGITFSCFFLRKYFQNRALLVLQRLSFFASSGVYTLKFHFIFCGVCKIDGHR